MDFKQATQRWLFNQNNFKLFVIPKKAKNIELYHWFLFKKSIDLNHDSNQCDLNQPTLVNTQH